MAVFEGASKPNAGYRDWDLRMPELVRCLMSEMGLGPEGVTIEHVGSTAVVDCGGKGIIDLLALYPDGALDDTKAWLLTLGLGRQGPEFSRTWPESRPMYLGSYRHVAEYCRVKRGIVSAGVTDTDEYAVQKRPFIHKALGHRHALRDDGA